MSMSVGSPFYMLNVVKWNQTHPDQFWLPFPSTGLFLEWSCIGKKESGVSFLCSSSLVYLLVQASAYLKIQQFCYWSIYIVRTTWPLNPSQALSGVLHWRDGHFFPHWWTGGVHFPHWQRDSLCMLASGMYREMSSLVMFGLADFRTKPPDASLTV